jgi:hypothetical protein
VQIPPSTLIQETSNTLERAPDLFTDCTILVNSNSVVAHRVMLAARSPVWKKMFAENPTQNKFTVNDFSVEAFKKFLKLVYSDITDFDTEAQKDEVKV